MVMASADLLISVLLLLIFDAKQNIEQNSYYYM